MVWWTDKNDNESMLTAHFVLLHTLLLHSPCIFCCCHWRETSIFFSFCRFHKNFITESALGMKGLWKIRLGIFFILLRFRDFIKTKWNLFIYFRSLRFPFFFLFFFAAATRWIWFAVEVESFMESEKSINSISSN